MNVRPSAIIIRENSVLTLRYCYGNQDVYALPGGNPDPGECLSAALSRELFEELEIETVVKEMIFCGEVIWPELNKETLHVVFTTEISSGTPQLNPVHTTALEIVWLPINELQDRLLYPNVGGSIIDFYNKSLTTSHIGVIDQPYIR